MMSELKFLCIDDDAINRRLLGAMLRSMEVAMTEASDGTEGLETMEREAFDLVFVDLHMPRVDGLQVLETARRRHGTNTPMVVMTADASDHVHALCRKAGADAVMQKPLDRRQLCRLAAGLLTETQRAA